MSAEVPAAAPDEGPPGSLFGPAVDGAAVAAVALDDEEIGMDVDAEAAAVYVVLLTSGPPVSMMEKVCICYCMLKSTYNVTVFGVNSTQGAGGTGKEGRCF